MGLEARLRQLELKIRPVNNTPERTFDIDQFIIHLGLDPTAARESAHRTKSSLAVAISTMLGMEPREFARQIREMANGGR